MTQWTYKDAGVDIARGEDFVKQIDHHARSTRRPGADGQLGGFGALFDLKALKMKDPLLVAACDGVGTKVKLAVRWGVHHGIGVDLVAMCVNDLLVQGATPLFFLDYWACEKIDSDIGEHIIASIAQGCRQADCALIGGETAEMPGVYRQGEYDLAGFAVGAVERTKLIDGRGVQAGDVAIGIESSGLHANGFSLLRKILDDTDAAQRAPCDALTLQKQLMEPTRIYVRALHRAIQEGKILALAHITGGGVPGNIGRVLPKGLALAWRPPPLSPLFAWLARETSVDALDMLSTFNLGTGMIALVRRTEVDQVREMIEQDGYPTFEVGSIVKDEKQAPCFLDTDWQTWLTSS